MKRPESAPSDGATDLLRRAADSLDDARLLAERRRPNEAVLTRLALHQALRAISVAQGLDADDDLRLDTLVRRVPPGHPQAALISRLRDDAAQTIAAVAELVEALSHPVPEPGPAPRARPPPARPRTGPDPDPSGPTALGSSPQRDGRADVAASVPSAAFWTLMDRWQVPDLEALALIGHPGGLTRKGTRPRFRLQGAEAVRYSGLRALDQALEGLALDPRRWLRAPQQATSCAGDTPLTLLQQDVDAARPLLHALHRYGLKAMLKGD